jgi:energy-coupling factor transporter ATP-binding protein EcfA2
MIWPTWIENLRLALPIGPLVSLSGNIKDLHLTPSDGMVLMLPLHACIWEALKLSGYKALLRFDRNDGWRVWPATNDAAELLRQVTDATGSETASQQKSLRSAATVIERVMCTIKDPVAVLVENASWLSNPANAGSDATFDFYSALEQFASRARTISKIGRKVPLYNPVIFALKGSNDLPAWFAVNNESLRRVTIPLPERAVRARAVDQIATMFVDGSTERSRGALVDATEGLSLAALISAVRIAQFQGLAMADAPEAVRAYRLGVVDNPWKQTYLKAAIEAGEAQLTARVKGQPRAVKMALDILKRSVSGLSGAQTNAKSSRPRGVLFFAGPTGVGKTELAKAITALIFRDETAYIRFDMSEFSAEHSDQRLIGAPPSYVGFEAGGELTNAIRQKPFSLILFDEIEKAHPRVLDKFLQILEDGRLTDGRGETAYFSESVIVFTSNLGIYRRRIQHDENGAQTTINELVVQPGTPFDEMRRLVLQAITDHFKFTLQRPELLNRIGENIEVFNFIDGVSGGEILEHMLSNVKRRVHEEHQINLQLSPAYCRWLREYALGDLAHGGRGIGNKLEVGLINPLADAVFFAPPGTLSIHIDGISESAIGLTLEKRYG